MFDEVAIMPADDDFFRHIVDWLKFFPIWTTDRNSYHFQNGKIQRWNSLFR